MKHMNLSHRVFAILLSLLLVICMVPANAFVASAATSTTVASKISANLPIVTYAAPLSGASRVYSYSNSSLSTKTTGYYIDTFKDQIVITQVSSDGRAVYVTYPSSSSSTKVRSRWFATDDILGLTAINISSFTASAKTTVYRMSSTTSVVSNGSISKGDYCTRLGTHTVNGTTYNVTIYPISSQTINRVGSVKHKIALEKASDTAATVQNGSYYIVSALNSNLCLDISWGSSANGANVQIYTRNNSAAQAFVVTNTGNGSYSIMNKGSGKMLDVAWGVASAGTNVQQYTSNGTASQRWYFESAGNGYYYIRSALGNLYLDVCGGVAGNGVNVQIWTPNKSNAQKFLLVPTDTTAVQQRLSDIANGSVTYNSYTVMTVGSTFTGTRANEQCKGYAKNVWYLTFGITPNSTRSKPYNYLLKDQSGMALVGSVTNKQESDVRNLFLKAKPGDFVQIRRNHTGSHSAIVYGFKDTNGDGVIDTVTFLEANTDDKNGIFLNDHTWSELTTKNDAISIYTATNYTVK